MTAGIYRIDGPNSKVYIGSSVNIAKRIYEHCRLLRKGTHSNQKLQHAWNKYGENAFTFKTVEEVSDKTKLLYYEQIWLDILFTSLDESEIYNICKEANSTSGRVMLDSTREKIRASNTGKPGSRRGAKLSEETKRKLSEAKKGKASTTGMSHSEETKCKISEAQKRRLSNPEARKRISDARKSQAGIKRGIYKRKDALLNIHSGKEIVLVDIDNIYPGKFNPASRTERRRLKNLEESISTRGFLPEYPIIVGNDGKTIGDGHRRYTVAKKLRDLGDSRFEQVPVLFSDMSSEEIFVFNTVGKATLNSAQLLESVANGVDINDLPANFRSKYNTIVDTCGLNAITFLLEYGVSPDIINRLKKVLKYIDRYADEIIIDTVFSFKVLKWAVHTNSGYRMRTFVDEGGNVDQLLHAINQNKPLPRAY